MKGACLINNNHIPALMPIKIMVLMLTFCLGGCNFAREEATIVPTATTVRVVVAQGTPVPTMNIVEAREVREIATATLEAELEPVTTDESPTPTNTPDPSCLINDGLPITQNTVNAEINYAQKTAHVQHDIRYMNTTNTTLNDLVINIEPNRWAEMFALESVEIANALEDNIVTDYELTGRRLRINLSAPISAGCAADIRLVYQLTPQPVGQGLSSFSGYFGYTLRQMNLGHWLATMAVQRGGEWISYDTALVGEQIVADAANWDVTIRVTSGAQRIQIAAPGVLSRPDGDTWHYTLEGTREFPVSLSDVYNVTVERAANGVLVELYTFDHGSGNVDGAGHALLSTMRSLEMYSDLFGAYPYSRFLVVEGDFADGMEFSNLVFVGNDWFRTFAGTADSYLTIITIHEVAHQWWYASVGNDQAMTPWLDEALATYSEYIYYEEFHPELRDWWWEFRVNSFLGNDYAGLRVDTPVYTFTSIRQYINAVYLRGARMLHELRGVLGTDPFFDWLRRYAEAGSGRVTSADMFWSLLTPEQLELTRDIREAYLIDIDFSSE